MLSSLPNILTLSRVLVIPFFVLAFWLDGALAHWIPVSLFILASATDFLDGYLARRLNAVSAFGRFLDPIADKLLVAAALVMLIENITITGLHIIAALLILCREIVVSGLREYLAEAQISLPVSTLAKWKTALQMIAISVLLLGPAGPTGTITLGLVLLWGATLLTLRTGYDYLQVGLAYMAHQDQGNNRSN